MAGGEVSWGGGVRVCRRRWVAGGGHSWGEGGTGRKRWASVCVRKSLCALTELSLCSLP